MGKILFLADIHGNMPALTAMEKEIEKICPDRIVFVGDAVGKGPEGDLAVDWVRAHCDTFVRGNWDELLCIGYRKREPRFEYFWHRLGEERVRWLEGLPLETEVLISGIWFRVVHGRPLDRLYQPADSFEDLEKGFLSKTPDREYHGYVCADCHMPYVRSCRLGYAVNTGSVGNSIGYPMAHAALLEGEIGSEERSPLRMEILSVPYDNREAARVADTYPDMTDREAYQKEVLTGVYTRRE